MSPKLVIILLVTFFVLLTTDVSSAMACLEGERQALIMFKRDLVDEANRLASWVDVEGANCCDWAGVSCSNFTSHVTGLHLQLDPPDYPYSISSYEAYERSQLKGTINPSLFHLKHLRHLNLSWNDFGGAQIPTFLGSMASLKQLDLSYAGFRGKIPPQFGNLTNLRYLGLARDYDMSYVDPPPLTDNLHWLSGLSLLLYLDLSRAVNLSMDIGWLDTVNTLPSLVELRLSGCELAHIPPLPLHNNLSSLDVLDLSSNGFGGYPIPKWIFHLHNLHSLDLSFNDFQVPIPEGLQNMSHLMSLYLSYNHLNSSISQWISHLYNLRTLDLSWNDFQGPIPEGLQNMTHLMSLDLSHNHLNSSISQWISHLHNLRTLDLSWNDFQGPIPEGLQNMTHLMSLHFSSNHLNSSIPDWLYSFSNSLEFLSLGDNNLQGLISSAGIWNLTSLSLLDLSFNENLEVEGWGTVRSVGHLCNLKSLRLSRIKMKQDVVHIFNDLSLSCASNVLEELFLGSAGISGNLTDVPFEKFIPLVSLSIEDNSISGSIPQSFWELRSLQFVDFSENMMAGVVSEDHFAKFTKLSYFRADGNKQLELKVSPSWIPPFQLETLSLGSWHLGNQFPQWLRSQNHIEFFNLSNCGIIDTLPEWLWNFSLALKFIILSRNNIFGEIPSMAGEIFWEGYEIDLGSNQLTGQVPVFYSKVENLDLSNNLLELLPKEFWNFSASFQYISLANNRIVGEIPSSNPIAIAERGLIDLSSNKFYGKTPLFSSNLALLDLSNNSFSGSIFHFLCHEANESKEMEALNLGDNLLSGEIPDCWTTWSSLTAVKLNNNNFTGGIPSSIQHLSLLKSLHIRNNSLRGGLSFLFQNSLQLVVVDLAENELTGEIPARIGKSSNLTILDLRSNKLRNKIPKEICSLTSLQIIDFASNNLSGNIPGCINNFEAMRSNSSIVNQLRKVEFLNYGLRLWSEEAIVVMKGRIMEYGNTLNLVRLIDFSENSLSGEIPVGVTSLASLHSLNLSHNFFTGGIPQEVGAMKEMESLDLSMNKLSGEIPQSISSLNFLSHLNLSYNNLTGRIPKGTQLQSFNASSFSGNELCGLPLLESCEPIVRNATSRIIKHGYTKGFYVAMAYGFVFGFWVVVFPIFFNRRWRIVYFNSLDHVGFFFT